MSDDSQMTPAEGSDVVAETSYQPGDVDTTPSPVSTSLQPEAPTSIPAPDVSGNPTAPVQMPISAPATAPPPPPKSAGQPSVWKDIVMGALTGLAGSAGATHFGGGVAGGAANTINQTLAAKQRAFEDNLQQQKNQSDIKFQDAQSAHLAAETAVKEREVNSWDQDHQEEHTKSQLDIATKLQNLGFTPIASTDDNNDAAMATGRNLTKTNGAVGPTYTLDLGKSHLTFALDQIAGSPQGLDIVNRQRTGLGQTPLTAAQFQQLKPSDRIAATKQALDFAHPTIANQKQMDDAQSRLATMQAQPNPSDDLKADIASLQQSIDLGQKVIAGSNKATNTQAEDKAHATASGKAAGTPAKATAPEKPGNMMFGSMPDGSQVAGTPDELKAAGASGIMKMDSGDAAKTLVARQLVAPNGLFHAVDRDMRELDAQGKLGVAASRWNDITANKVGDNPEFARLSTDMGLIHTAIMQAHVGARGSKDMLEHFEGLMNQKIASGPQLRAQMAATFSYMQEKAMLPKKAAQ